MLPTTAANGHPRHPHVPYSPAEKPARGWAAYNDRDDKWRKGSDNLLASWLRSAGKLVDGSTVADLLTRTRPPAFDGGRGAAPVAGLLPSIQTVRFVLLCGLWYLSSALSSNTGKAIMTRFKYPVTLTFVQFGFVAAYCLIFASPVLRFTRIREPNAAIIRSTLPMAGFQVLGHITSSMAISRIPVSTVHTIKVRLAAALFGRLTG